MKTIVPCLPTLKGGRGDFLMKIRFFPILICGTLFLSIFTGASFAADTALDKKDTLFGEMAYVVKIKKKFDTVVSDLKDSIIDHNYKLINISNIKKGLGSRDVEFGEYTIVEFCNLTLAEKVLKRDLRFGLLMPCRVGVYEDKDEVVLITIRPTFIVKHLGDPSLMESAMDIEKQMIDIMDSVK